MVNQNKNPQSLGEILPGVLNAIESGTPILKRSDQSSIDYEEGNNSVLRDAAAQPGVSDKEVDDLAGIIHQGDLAINAIKSGMGHHASIPDKQ